MSVRQNSASLVASAEIVAPPPPRCCEDRTFELPPVLYGATALLFLGFVSILTFAFRTPAMAVPFGIFVIFLVAFFAVPALWPRMMAEEDSSRAMGWTELGSQGIQTPHGKASARDATVLVLLLPFVIFCWAIAVAMISALD